MPRTAETFCFSCVVDDRPLFRSQALNWLATLLASGSARPDEIVVHVVRGTDPSFVEALRRRGVAWREVEPWDERAPHCNKLTQIETPELAAAECAVLCDTDVAFVGDVRPWLASDTLRAKVVDYPKPPLELLQRLLDAAGIGATPRLVRSSFGDARTFETNCNGGIYAIPGHMLGEVGEAWRRWARFAIDHADSLGAGALAKHADQIGFCFALLELDLPFEGLPTALNFPTHLPVDVYADRKVEPVVLHYHSRMDANGALLPLGIRSVDEAVASANAAVRADRRRHLDNSTFWDYRYTHHAELGSGSGSRGKDLAYRREILYPWLSRFRDRDVLDVGCGDLELTAGADARSYTGVDVSAAAIAIAAEKRPDWTFLHGEIEDVGERTFDLVLNGCMLIHVPGPERYEELVRRLIDVCGDTLIIEAYDAAPTKTSEITFYHEPISETLRRDERIAEVVELGRYRDISMVLARRVGADSSPSGAVSSLPDDATRLS